MLISGQNDTLCGKYTEIHKILGTTSMECSAVCNQVSLLKNYCKRFYDTKVYKKIKLLFRQKQEEQF
jgi:hypothetical protein